MLQSVRVSQSATVFCVTVALMKLIMFHVVCLFFSILCPKLNELFVRLLLLKVLSLLCPLLLLLSSV